MRVSRYSFVYLVGILLAGCSGEYLPDGYGRRTGDGYGDSVNGTAVMANMFQAAGHRVTSWGTLSPTLERVDVIVWFPDDIQPPLAEIVRWFEDWLAGGEQPRTLVYVGRDFDAAPLYYQKVVPGAPAAIAAELSRRQADAEKHWASIHEKLKDGAKCGWFEYDLLDKPRNLGSLSGPWSAGVNGSKTEIQVNSRMVVDPAVERLLSSADETLVARMAPDHWDGSQVILVENGSFLLNLPLVNHEHRKLAGALIDEVQKNAGPGAPVVFLESGPGGLRILDEDPRLELPPGPADRPPLIYVWHHAILAGVLLVFASWSIFGRPRRTPTPPRSDFGQHVQSLGDLLERSGDREFCQARLDQYATAKAPPGSERP